MPHRDLDFISRILRHDLFCQSWNAYPDFFHMLDEFFPDRFSRRFVKCHLVDPSLI